MAVADAGYDYYSGGSGSGVFYIKHLRSINFYHFCGDISGEIIPWLAELKNPLAEYTSLFLCNIMQYIPASLWHIDFVSIGCQNL